MGKTFQEVYGDWKGFSLKTTKKIYKQGLFSNKKEVKSFYKFMLSRSYLGNRRYVDDMTWLKCWELVQEIKKGNDNFLACVGHEGAGKSFVAKQIAPILDPNFNMDKILYQPDNLPDLIENAKKGDCIVFDEGAMFLHSADHSSGLTKQLTKLFTVMRVTGLNIIVCIPNFFLLNKYAREQRVKTLIYVYKRGHFRVFKRDAVTRLSIEGKKKNDKIDQVAVPYDLFYEGRCGSKLSTLIDETQYDKNKDVGLKELVQDLRSVIKIKGETKKKNDMLRVHDVARITGVKEQTIRLHIVKGFLKAKKMGTIYYVDPEDCKKYQKGFTTEEKKKEKKKDPRNSLLPETFTPNDDGMKSHLKKIRKSDSAS